MADPFGVLVRLGVVAIALLVAASLLGVAFEVAPRAMLGLVDAIPAAPEQLVGAAVVVALLWVVTGSPSSGSSL